MDTDTVIDIKRISKINTKSALNEYRYETDIKDTYFVMIMK
jgi:hypothetical protein